MDTIFRVVLGIVIMLEGIISSGMCITQSCDDVIVTVCCLPSCVLISCC